MWLSWTSQLPAHSVKEVAHSIVFFFLIMLFLMYLNILFWSGRIFLLCQWPERTEDSWSYWVGWKVRWGFSIRCYSLTVLKPLTVWITTNWEFLKRWEYQTTFYAPWETCMQDKKLHLELDMEQQTGSNLEKEYVKAVYCHPAYLIYMQSTLC